MSPLWFTDLHLRTLVPLSAKLGLGPGSARILCIFPVTSEKRQDHQSIRPSSPPRCQMAWKFHDEHGSAVLFPILALRVWPRLSLCTAAESVTTPCSSVNVYGVWGTTGGRPAGARGCPDPKPTAPPALTVNARGRLGFPQCPPSVRYFGVALSGINSETGRWDLPDAGSGLVQTGSCSGGAQSTEAGRGPEGGTRCPQQQSRLGSCPDNRTAGCGEGETLRNPFSGGSQFSPKEAKVSNPPGCAVPVLLALGRGLWRAESSDPVTVACTGAVPRGPGSFPGRQSLPRALMQGPWRGWTSQRRRRDGAEAPREAEAAPVTGVSPRCEGNSSPSRECAETMAPAVRRAGRPQGQLSWRLPGERLVGQDPRQPGVERPVEVLQDLVCDRPHGPQAPVLGPPHVGRRALGQ